MMMLRRSRTLMGAMWMNSTGPIQQSRNRAQPVGPGERKRRCEALGPGAGPCPPSFCPEPQARPPVARYLGGRPWRGGAELLQRQLLEPDVLAMASG